MAKAYYFNYIPASGVSNCPNDEVVSICDRMMQIAVEALKEYGLHVRDDDFVSYNRKEKKLLSDEKCFRCIYPDKCDAAWNPGTWDYSKDKLGEIFIIFKKDNKIVVSFGSNRIAKETANREIIECIRNKAVASGILPQKAAIYETEERTVEKSGSNTKSKPVKVQARGNNGEQIIEKTDEKVVYRRTCHQCNGKGKVQVKEAMQSFSRDKTNLNVEKTCAACNGTGYLTIVDYIGKYRVEKEVSLKEFDNYLKEECKIQDKIFALIEKIMNQYVHVLDKDSFWVLLEKEQFTDNRKTLDEETTTYTFILDFAGKLRCKESYVKIIVSGPGGTSRLHGSKGDVSFQNFDEYLREFDFNVLGRYVNATFLEYTHLTRDYKDYAYRSDSDMAYLRRRYEKGYGLYYALKSILEEKKQPQKPEKPVSTTNHTKKSASRGSSSGGCYIATAVYGSYDCPEVWILRRFRDNSLAKSMQGRLFIKAYYAVSPVMVNVFGNTAWFQKFWKGRLDKLVLELKKKGYADSPYRDF